MWYLASAIGRYMQVAAGYLAAIEPAAGIEQVRHLARQIATAKVWNLVEFLHLSPPPEAALRASLYP